MLAVANMCLGVGVNVRRGDEAPTSDGAGGAAGGGNEGHVGVELE